MPAANKMVYDKVTQPFASVEAEPSNLSIGRQDTVWEEAETYQVFISGLHRWGSTG